MLMTLSLTTTTWATPRALAEADVRRGTGGRGKECGMEGGLPF
jgi:hypothetical protein